MASVKQAVKASLVGTEESPESIQLSQQVKKNFTQYARKDEESGDLYMTEEDFVNAIAPKNQDYVSHSSARHPNQDFTDIDLRNR